MTRTDTCYVLACWWVVGVGHLIPEHLGGGGGDIHAKVDGTSLIWVLMLTAMLVAPVVIKTGHRPVRAPVQCYGILIILMVNAPIGGVITRIPVNKLAPFKRSVGRLELVCHVQASLGLEARADSYYRVQGLIGIASDQCFARSTAIKVAVGCVDPIIECHDVSCEGAPQHRKARK